jgi:16S rRNA (cytosine1402-N4)-methyltransferase
VNNELGEIETLLKSAGSLLKPGGRLVLISFHSLEDRLVKDAFKAAKAAKIFEVLTKKPVVASEQEQMRNPRSRSAKLRAAEKV